MGEDQSIVFIVNLELNVTSFFVKIIALKDHAAGLPPQEKNLQRDATVVRVGIKCIGVDGLMKK